MASNSIRILHTNDLHGRLDADLTAKISARRVECDLYFDSGDSIKSGNLAVPLKPELAWSYLAQLDCTASVPGNRESHVIRSAFDSKLSGHVHPVLCANLYDKQGARVLPSHLLLEAKGIRVGILGVMVPMVTAGMKSKAVSQLIWTDPIPEAVAIAEELRSHCDLVIALTHIGFRQDRLLAQSTRALDLIFGGHSHTVLDSPVRVGDTWICQGGSHGRYFGTYDWTAGMGLTQGSLSAWA